MKNKGLRFLILFALTASWIYLMRLMTSPLDSSKIIAFEFIGSAQKARVFLSGLRSTGELNLLTISIFLDFIFPLLYGATFYYAAAWICSKLPSRHIFKRFKIIANMTIIAVFSDFFENLSLLGLIHYPPTDLLAMSAYVFAGIKFVMLGLVLIHFITSGLIIGIDQVNPQAAKTMS